MKNQTIYHIRIENIRYRFHEERNQPSTVCIIHWINPVNGNIQVATGVAKLKDGETFDRVKGGRIAESRAKINMWKTYCNCLTRDVDFIVDKHDALIYNEANHIDDLRNE